ncbi:MAG: trans-sulfuration enzyme family protein [Pyrinomonadaceae bacterium]
MSDEKRDAFDDAGWQTRLTHGDADLNATHALVPPIWQTSTFGADSPEHFAELVNSAHPTEFYTRYGNPTHAQVERLVSTLEGGEAALVAGSGMGSIFTAVMCLLEKGDHVVAQRSHYGGTSSLFETLLPRWGIERTVVDQTDPENFARALQPNTKLIYTETPTNPVMTLTDLRAVSEIARARNITTMCDNTFATPINQRPIELGIDVVLHSATKYIGGHHDVTAGVIVGSREFIERAWSFSLVAGASLSPFDGWLLLRGLRTLALRVERHNQNALALARFLESHEKVERVNYPGLESHPQHTLARRQMSGFTGVLSVELRGGYEAAEKLITSLRLGKYAASLGGYETLLVHPAAMWAKALTAEQRRAMGVGDNLVRVSVGLEDERDLVRDFTQALEKL